MKIPGFKRRTPEDRERRRLTQALERLQAASAEDRLRALAQLIVVVRPKRCDDVPFAEHKLQVLTALVGEQPELRRALRDALLWLVNDKHCIRLFTDSGIMADEGFFSGLWRRIGSRVLPEEHNDDQLRDALTELFARERDYLWVSGVGDDIWICLLDALQFEDVGVGMGQTHQRMHLQMLEALQVISYRIAAIGLDPELVRNHPAIEHYESPFVMQNVELREFMEERKRAMTEKRLPTVDDKQLLVLLQQCEQVIGKVRKQAAQTGASVRLTALLRRLRDLIERQKALLQLIEFRDPHALNIDRVRLFKRLVKTECLRYSVRTWGGRAMDLLASRIMQNASRAGEQYITTTRSEFFHLFRSAMGAGFIVAIMAWIKIGLATTPRSPFGEALAFSANYVAGFVLMYVLHFSLATKQPAMTANAIAQSLDGEGGSRQHRIDALVELVVRTFRSQFIAVAGNLILAVPLAFAIARAVLAQTGHHTMHVEKAEYLLHDADPLALHVWIWGAITGVWLFVSGLISGYYDNRAIYDRVPQRFARFSLFRRLLSNQARQRLANYVERHFGGLMGSIAFGLMLGSTAAIGRILGLPVDTLHVTFTAANSAYAVNALPDRPGWEALLRIAAGVTVIGLMNLSVSFGLAMWVALRAQRVRFAESRALIGGLFKRLLTTPSHFFWPPRDPVLGDSPREAMKAGAERLGKRVSVEEDAD